VNTDAWMAFNVSLANVETYAKIAVEKNIKRVIFAVPSDENLPQGETFPKVSKMLGDADIDYTIMKYNQPFKNGEESKWPYRIVNATAVVPFPNPSNKFNALTSGDFFRVFTESLDLKMSYRQVYGIGPGFLLEAEILAKMKSNGWPEHVQVVICE
jgi:uncharacterized protein YbjT (DUF2867 family)